MGHTCPDCGQACYCGGDIDDCIFDMPDDVNRCTHCPDDEADDGFYEEVDEDDYTPHNCIREMDQKGGTHA